MADLEKDNMYELGKQIGVKVRLNVLNESLADMIKHGDHLSQEEKALLIFNVLMANPLIYDSLVDPRTKEGSKKMGKSVYDNDFFRGVIDNIINGVT